MVKHTRTDEPTIDRQIRPGDVAIDQTQGSWVYVVDYASPEVAVWNKENNGDLLADYAGNWLCGATLGDQVFTVVYLSGNGVKSAPGKTYDFPESRLARLPVEEANLDLRRPQTVPLESFLRELLESAKRKDWTVSESDETLDDALEGGLGDWVRETARDALGYAPLDFPDADDVVDDADADAEDRVEDAKQRWEERQERLETESDDDQDADSDEESASIADDAGFCRNCLLVVPREHIQVDAVAKTDPDPSYACPVCDGGLADDVPDDVSDEDLREFDPDDDADAIDQDSDDEPKSAADEEDADDESDDDGLGDFEPSSA